MTFLVLGVMSSTVYPRVCGVDYAAVLDNKAYSGLSPRVRGRCSRASMLRVRLGLSPRVRGRYVGQTDDKRQTRFIPACAG